ncbi:MAG: hypothetical protein QXP42_01955 [Candidatus Micrarchaeia archaeon]
MEINYEVLRRVEENEKKPMLSELPEDFFESATAFIKRVKTELEGGFSIKKAKEYENALKIIRRIYYAREQKILLAALRSRRKVDDTKNMLKNESKLYESVLRIIEEYEEALEKMILPERDEEVGKGRREAFVATVDIPQFVGPDGRVYGPYKSGEDVSVPMRVAEVLMKKNALAKRGGAEHEVPK